MDCSRDVCKVTFKVKLLEASNGLNGAANAPNGEALKNRRCIAYNPRLREVK